MESTTPRPLCAKEALDLLNCAADSGFDREKCIGFLEALRNCIQDKKVKRFSLAEQSPAEDNQIIKEFSSFCAGTKFVLKDSLIQSF